MNIDEILESKQVVNEEKFESGNEAQESATSILMDLVRNADVSVNGELLLDFFFYTNQKEKAQELTNALRKFGYVVRIGERTASDLKYSITGQTIPMPAEDDVVLDWSKKMNELGYVHDCQFDGWGTSTLKGGWFSDDTPEEELRRRLGMPPL